MDWAETSEDRKGATRTTSNEDLQKLSDGIFGLGNVLACYIVNLRGDVLGGSMGKIPADAEVFAQAGPILATLWGVLRRPEEVTGPLSYVTITYSNFTVLGIPIPRLKVVIYVAVPSEMSARAMKERILEFVRDSSPRARLRRREI